MNSETLGDFLRRRSLVFSEKFSKILVDALENMICFFCLLGSLSRMPSPRMLVLVFPKGYLGKECPSLRVKKAKKIVPLTTLYSESDRTEIRRQARILGITSGEFVRRAISAYIYQLNNQQQNTA